MGEIMRNDTARSLMGEVSSIKIPRTSSEWYSVASELREEIENGIKDGQVPCLRKGTEDVCKECGRLSLYEVPMCKQIGNELLAAMQTEQKPASQAENMTANVPTDKSPYFVS